MLLEPGGGGYLVRKLLGVCRGPLKIGAKKIEGKMVFWVQKDQILWGFVPKRSFLCWWMRKKTPQKDRVWYPEGQKRGSKKPRHICITHHIGSTPPPPPPPPPTPPRELSALLQLHLHSRLNTWLQRVGQRRLQDEMRIISILGFGASYIRDFTVALVFEAVQSRPMTTFPESWHDYPKQYFRSFAQRSCLPGSPNWSYEQNYNVIKWQVRIWEAFIGWMSASPGAMDGWHCWQNIPNLKFFASMPRNWYIIHVIN